MGYINWGIEAGLAHKHNYQADLENQLRIGQVLRQKQADQAEEATLLADKFRAGKANNPYDQQMLKDYTESKTKEAGAFIRRNPNWKIDPEARIYLNQVSDDLLSNPHVMRSQWYDKQMEASQAAIAKNPALAQTPEYLRFIQDAHNYATYGDADGNEELGKQGNGRRIQWATPDTSDVVTDLLEIGSKLGTTESYNPNLYGAGLGGTSTQVPDSTLTSVAYNLYKNPQYAARLDANWNRLGESGRAFYGDNKLEWAKSLIKSGKNQSNNPVKFGNGTGDPNETKLQSSYYNDIMSKPPNTRSYSAYTSSISPVVDGKYQVGSEGLRIALTDPDGTIKWTKLNGYNGQFFDGAQTTPEVVKGPSGETFVGIRLQKVPITDEIVRGLPIINSTDYNQSTTDYGEMSVNPKYKPYVSIEKDKDGKPTGFVNMTAYVRAIEDAGTVSNYEKSAAGVDFANKHTGDAFILKQQRALSEYAPGTIVNFNDGSQRQKQQDGSWAIVK